MSDLHCPATVLVARHGEAEHESELLSDAGGSLTATGRAQSRELADCLADRNVALVYTSPLSPAVQTAEIVAGRLGCSVRVREAFVEPPADDSAEHVIARMSAGLEEIADLHRGETVLVVTHGWVMGLVLPHLAANLPDSHGVGRPLPGCCPVRMSVDADGWHCAEWPEA
jgi:broad specificity phosphatase PhoE